MAAAPEAATTEAPVRSYVNVQASIVIHRPPSEVFAFVSDAENDVHWRSEVVSMKNLTAPPHRVGTRTLEVAKVLGKQLETTTEITEFVPGERMARHTVTGLTPVVTARAVEPVADGARFTYQLTADVTDVFLFRAFRPVLEWWTQRKVAGYLDSLKAHLEVPVGSNSP
ncbi:SRPBCC family protein [Piscinibacter sp. HJYY11]|uniref:SRPBCC family protein n=1 Tax=Piscinibacter sp. HJYY11 TaxID=2801333 RepID=UPI001F4213EB|nr:SRPBCC family protein [Piscinibacter sp. HJYY11]